MPVFGPSKICQNCGKTIPESYQDCPHCGYDFRLSKSENDSRKRAAQEQEKKRLKLEKSLVNIKLSTCQTIVGYRIVEDLGIVYGENIYTNDTLDFYLCPEFIAEARQVAEQNLRREAALKGANAVIGVHADFSVVPRSMYVNIYGTAVKIEKE